MRRLFSSAAFLLSTVLLLPLAAFAASGSEAPDREIDLAVSHDLAEALARDGVAPVAITLDLTVPAKADHPAAQTDVHPTVFDIAMLSAGAVPRLEPTGDLHVLHIDAGEAALGQILAMEEVVAVELGEAPDAGLSAVPTKMVCPSTSTRACLLTNWGVTASYGGTTGKVGAISSASSSSQSATFWAFGSSNWEIVAKIINGCSINNNWWLFAGPAGDLTYSVGVRIFLPGGDLGLGSFTANQAPILNTTLLSCS